MYDGFDSSGSLSPATDDLVVVNAVITPDLYKATLSIGGMTCSSCVSSITRAVQQLPFVRSIDVNLLTHSGTVIYEGKHRVDEIVTAIEDTGFDATVDNITEAEPHHPAQRSAISPIHHDKRWRAVYAISGMTCSSCVGHVTEAIRSHRPWVDQVDVNLLSNSASVIFTGKDHLPEIQESIEDAGFDATLDSIVAEDDGKREVVERTVSIRVDGMYCQHCPGRITRGLEERYGTNYTFEFKNPRLTSKAPKLTFTYLPAPPDFTVRHILQTIKDLDPAFQPRIYHAPTIEDRAREVHLRERRHILFRMLLSITVAIPTFLIGIVFMSLVNPKNHIRQYIMEPMWAGNVTRTTWALFILATPVYFFAADIFHVRAIKEIRAIWRPGSRIPILQRFTRFGSMNMLMSLGTSIAYFASVVELALAATKQSSGGMTDSYFDAVVFLTMFLLIGRFLEAYSKAKTGDAVTSLGKLRPEEAILVESETGDRKIATDLLEIGDIVRVPHGTSPPFDGIIIEGNCNFDESSLTGESRPVKKEAGDIVYSGTINRGQPIKVRITTISGTSMLDQIINVVREGQTRRAPVERVADTITSHFVPFVVCIAIVTWVVWLSLGTSGVIPKGWKNEGSGGWALWSLRFAIAVFVIACPCGIGLAAPTALFVGGGLAAKHGILVKGGGEAFQEASSLDCIVFDKTGTLTQGGDPSVTDHAFAQAQDESLVLGIVKALEESSSHPIARALVSFCNTRGTKTPAAKSLDEVPGKGLKGTFCQDGKEIVAIIGNEAYMADHRVSISGDDAARLQSWKAKGRSVALVALLHPLIQAQNQRPSSPAAPSATARPSSVAEHRWELAAMFGIADALRPEAIKVIQALKDRGLDVWMLSGDNPITANAVGAQVGIPSSNIIAGVLPDQKAEKIKYLQRTLTKTNKTSLFRIPLLSRFHTRKQAPKRAIIAMVGDGINDAPALSTADLSIAIGSGSDIALSSSSFILINSHLTTLLTLLDLSRVVFRRVYFNFGWALVYNLIAMPVAAGVLYPIKTGTTHMAMHHNGVGMEGGMGMGDGGEKHVRLDPVWASLAMALSSVSVVCSSLALRTRIPAVGFRDRKEADNEVENQGIA
ncbi:heavy metal translocatin [Westerdykella ornata]|uniref:Heavy metal translocatin n=1 Tax=Westerdykella ornata TaxID=318751 RepID=A0A6A6JLR3_WESOR|nr:heavy metal translocatin [Westerdykella ornata]KAF2277531.1 heavy metal translocatin [Westerdykella ornata]